MFPGTDCGFEKYNLNEYARRNLLKLSSQEILEHLFLLLVSAGIVHSGAMIMLIIAFPVSQGVT